ncbi:hypothetical protein M427DRAFT_36352 [Gonapodya prolifera JEL478]|uniref:Uncharacterized protein n=1 Tax=Gonapodya prolifera (strain JEL478) TaxID=1344416 RepID=A0A139A2K9_GONPJ|nr:hypothetical protein M427DRAFT_36352 [Gonapodya prolifera JEL478]|eukprot:KXS11020.1 hypothetical protein M427DRAFT_36352 [Gonapodya prolifera JEL478]
MSDLAINPIPVTEDDTHSEGDTTHVEDSAASVAESTTTEDTVTAAFASLSISQLCAPAAQPSPVNQYINNRGTQVTQFDNGAALYVNQDSVFAVGSNGEPHLRIRRQRNSEPRRIVAEGVNRHGNSWVRYSDGTFKYNNANGTQFRGTTPADRYLSDDDDNSEDSDA